jgi:multimeric flavodoxin WrbA
MGYTHYWTQTRDFTPEQMGDIAGSIRKIIDTASGRPGVHNYDDKPAVPLVICGGDGTGEPVLTKEKIAFNGQGPDLDHETFYFEAKRIKEDYQSEDQRGWAFCKTAQKPYDVVVTACLIFLAHDYGFQVSSDGDVEDWERGEKLVAEALGKEYPNPLIVEQLTA